jgi:LPXTG-motif cell wall-anchored protein
MPEHRNRYSPGTGWTCATPSASGEIVCTTGEDIEPGAAAPALTVTGIVTADQGEPVANTASVTAGGTDSVIANNAAEASGVVPSEPSTASTSNGGSTGGAGESLPATGSDPATAVLGLLFVAAGALLMTAGRRRHA